MLTSDILKLPVLRRCSVPDSLLDDIVGYQKRNEAAELGDLSYEVIASSGPDERGEWCHDVIVLRLRGDLVLLGFRSGKYGDDWRTEILDTAKYLEIFDRLRAVPEVAKAPDDIPLLWSDLILLMEAGVVDSRGPVQDLNHVLERLYALAALRECEILLTPRRDCVEAFPKAVVLRLAAEVPEVCVRDTDEPDVVRLTLR